MIQAVLFDLDGTLTRSEEGIWNCVRYAAEKLGFPVPLNDWLRQDEFYGQVKAAFEAPIAGRFFNQEAILALLDEHRAGAANMKKIWTVYCFLVWYDEYFVKR